MHDGYRQRRIPKLAKIPRSGYNLRIYFAVDMLYSHDSDRLDRGGHIWRITQGLQHTDSFK